MHFLLILPKMHVPRETVQLAAYSLVPTLRLCPLRGMGALPSEQGCREATALHMSTATLTTRLFGRFVCLLLLFKLRYNKRMLNAYIEVHISIFFVCHYTRVASTQTKILKASTRKFPITHLPSPEAPKRAHPSYLHPQF